MRTLEDINAELEQVRQKLDRARKLSAVMEDLKAQHEERKRAAEDALKVLYREQEDVEELERLSFASFLARIRGSRRNGWTKSGGRRWRPKPAMTRPAVIWRIWRPAFRRPRRSGRVWRARGGAGRP